MCFILAPEGRNQYLQMAKKEIERIAIPARNQDVFVVFLGCSGKT